ncbi:MAG TPA: carbohydrate-binding family 9-like protein [Terriglobales bacterium]|nr:carbohydrate-binding family 9-like protein [Terriglobales bacterium]
MNDRKCQVEGEIAAKRLLRNVGPEDFPTASEWEQAVPVAFCADWQGGNADEQRRTEVRMLWTPDTLFIRFVNRYRELLTFSDSEPGGYRFGLWERDVAEAFIQPDRFGTRNYKEFEISPNAMWIDLDIIPGGHNRLHSGLRRMAEVDTASKVWTAQMAIPIRSITEKFDPAKSWRVNFFRCEGTDPQRWYSAWRPTKTPRPNFHVPEAFGTMTFDE